MEHLNFIKEKVKRNNYGITLISLVVTIIVLLILAGISISMLSGNNGILSRTTEAREQTIIGQEKEEIGLAYTSLVGDNVVKGTEITDSLFEDEINRNRGANDVSVDSDSEDYIVKYESTKHTYLVKKDGTIEKIDTINIEPTENIYVTLYSDGTLAFSNNNTTDSSKTVSKTYTIGKNDSFDTEDIIPWKNERGSIIKVEFENKIIPTSTKNWFLKCENLQEMKHMNNLNTSKTINMSSMFDGCTALISIDMTKFSTGQTINMNRMFSDCKSLTTLNLNSFNTRNVRDMNRMFSWCTNLTSLDISSFNTSNVRDMHNMFARCFNLKNLNLSNFDTSSVTNMSLMFAHCRLIETLDLSSFDTSNVTDMNNMFYGCNSLTNLNLSKFDTSNVTNMDSMFSNDSGVYSNYVTIDLSGKFSTAKVESTRCMFANCNKLQHIYVGDNWDLSHVSDTTQMYNGASSARPEKK